MRSSWANGWGDPGVIQGVGVAVAISKKPGTDMVAAWLQGRA